MTHIAHMTEVMNDPDGSIFLPKDRLIRQFLSLEGDPHAILAAIAALGDTALVQTYGALQFSLLQSRGVEKLGEDILDDTAVKEVNKRMEFYIAIRAAVGRQAIEDAA